jgi:hypothetical protein
MLKEMAAVRPFPRLCGKPRNELLTTGNRRPENAGRKEDHIIP